MSSITDRAQCALAAALGTCLPDGRWPRLEALVGEPVTVVASRRLSKLLPNEQDVVLKTSAHNHFNMILAGHAPLSMSRGTYHPLPLWRPRSSTRLAGLRDMAEKALLRLAQLLEWSARFMRGLACTIMRSRFQSASADAQSCIVFNA